MLTTQSEARTDVHPMSYQDHTHEEAISLNIKNSTKAGDGGKSLNLKYQKTADTPGYRNKKQSMRSETLQMNDHIMQFVKRKNLPLVEQAVKLKNVARNKPASAKTRLMGS